MMRSRIEDAIQSEVIRKVKELYPHIRIFAIRNETNRYRTEECDIGHPDLQLEATAPDHIEYILKLEIKIIKGKLRDTQKKWNANFDSTYRKNCQRFIAYGTNEALAVIADWIKSVMHD